MASKKEWGDQENRNPSKISKNFWKLQEKIFKFKLNQFSKKNIK